jgi:ABC-type glutathione transport system ATPase component
MTDTTGSPPSGAPTTSLLEVRHLVKHFVQRQGLWRPPSVVKAVDDVTFSIQEGEMFGLVGSGVARARLTLHPAADRALVREVLAGEERPAHSRSRMRQARRHSKSSFKTLLVAHPGCGRAISSRTAHQTAQRFQPSSSGRRAFCPRGLDRNTGHGIRTN